MLRIIDGKNIYIPLTEIEADFSILRPYVTQACDTDVISESDYNYLVHTGKISGALSLTKVRTLAAEKKGINDLKPLKFLVLTGFGKSHEEIVHEIEEETKNELKRAVSLLLNGNPVNVDYDTMLKLVREAESKPTLTEAELTLQCLTKIANGRCALQCFLAGEGIFYELYADMDQLSDIDTLKCDSDITFWDSTECDDVILSRMNKRDFRQYSVLENILWCLQNLDVDNEFTDEVSYHEGGLSLSVDLPLVMKYINPASFADVLYIEGAADIRENVAVSSMGQGKEYGAD